VRLFSFVQIRRINQDFIVAHSLGEEEEEEEEEGKKR
jgi:hypothetical protein